MTFRRLIITGHAIAGCAIAGAIWWGCAASLAAAASPTVAQVKPFGVARTAACAGRLDRLVARVSL